MTDKHVATTKTSEHTFNSVDDLQAAGWTLCQQDGGFIEHVGPLWQFIDGKKLIYGFFAEEKHRNRSGAVHGGMLATLADRTLGATARLADPTRSQATIDLDIKYIDSARMGEFVTATARLLKETSTLAFLSGHLESNGRLIAHVSGIWRFRPSKRGDHK